MPQLYRGDMSDTYCEKYFKKINTVASIWRQNMLRYLSLDSFTRTFLSGNRSLLGTDIISAEKFPNIFRAAWRLFSVYSEDQDKCDPGD